MEWKCKSFDELSAREYHDLLALRVSVFVVEQNCAYQEVDGIDLKAFHLFAVDDQGEILALARLIPPGVAYDQASIGRVSTRMDQRRTGLGRELFRRAVEKTFAIFGPVPIKIMAQLYLEKFYSGYGFVTISEVFLEDDIPHVYMVLKP